MERGDGGSTARRDNNTQLNNAQDISKITLNKIKSLYPHRRIRHSTTVTYHDMTSAGYGWLLPGWIAEERRVPSGRVYRYYYDPEVMPANVRCEKP